MITDAFLDAKERLEERLNKSLTMAPENAKTFEISLSSDSIGTPLGVEVGAHLYSFLLDVFRSRLYQIQTIRKGIDF